MTGMTPVASAQQMRDIDRTTIDHWGIASLTLMETAGHAVLNHLLSDFDALEQKKITVFCGKGNNAGDGLVLARMLLGIGAQVRVILSHSKSEMSPDAQVNLNLLEKMDFKTELYENTNTLDLTQDKADILVDALLGTGIQGSVKGLFLELIQLINKLDAPTISIDLPSGMNADINEQKGECVVAQKTVCIGAAKPACIFSPTKEICGKVVVERIGFPANLLNQAQQFLVNRKKASWQLERHPNSHKGNSGKLLIYAGSKGMAGAAILSAKAAIRSGTAMVQLICHEELLPIFQETLPEAMVLIIPSDLELAFDTISQRCLNWADAFLIGPGLGQSDFSKSLTQKLVQNLTLPMVIDADALNNLIDHLSILKTRKAATIITPHPGEFNRLFKCSPATTGLPLMEQCRHLSCEHNIILHMKGAPSITACPDGSVLINGSGNSILSTAGSGDVLAGITGALLSQKFPASEAMCAAAYWHGRCAEKLAKASMLGHSAMDIATTIPQIIHE